jgi:hypothetical protein
MSVERPAVLEAKKTKKRREIEKENKAQRTTKGLGRVPRKMVEGDSDKRKANTPP